MDAIRNYFTGTNAELVAEQMLGTVVIVLIALVLYNTLSRAIGRLQLRIDLDDAGAFYLRLLVRWMTILLVGAALLQVWGVLANVWAAATAMLTLVAIGFVAVWSVLSNVLCSIILLAARPFRIGDVIEIPGDEIHGRVIEINLIQTELKADDGSVYQIPNNLFFQRIVKRHIPPASTRHHDHDHHAKRGNHD